MHPYPGVGNKTTPLYIVCSPRRRVGKTLISRLLIEFHDVDARPVMAFDLADEGPQLTDFMPERVTAADIGDIFGQIDFFDTVLADNLTTKVVDLSHRIFANFFIIIQKIGFFEEARLRGIQPILLFMVDPDPKSARAYSILQRWFTTVPLVPVRNHAVARGMNFIDSFPNAGAVQVSPEIPALGRPLSVLLDQHGFSFSQFWHEELERFPVQLDENLRPWMRRIFFQFRQIELGLMYQDILSMLEPH